MIPPLEERPIKPPDLHADDRSEVDKLPTNFAEDPKLTVIRCVTAVLVHFDGEIRVRSAARTHHEPSSLMNILLHD